jgi:geranylgeranyl pyrophosphate synthase
VGKTLGIDVEKGKLTLPVIHFLRTAPREHRELLRSLMRERGAGDASAASAGAADKVERIRNLILPSPSIDYARARARQHVARAKGALADLPDTDARRLLEAMADFVIARGA